MTLTARPPLDRRQLLLAGALSAAGLAGGCSRAAKPPRAALPKDATLLCLGDSLTFGYGAASGTSYPSVLEQLTGYVTRNAGINGDTSEGALARLPSLLQDYTPGMLLLSIGGNDFLRGVPLARTREALKQLVLTSVANTQVVLVAEPRPDIVALASGSLKDHEVYADVATETGVPLFAGAWSYVLSRPELRSDQIHANAEGYREFAEKLAAWLLEKKFIA
jgi:acyl-CoA thioesterase I